MIVKNFYCVKELYQIGFLAEIKQFGKLFVVKHCGIIRVTFDRWLAFSDLRNLEIAFYAFFVVHE